ncbi:competence/damage-inducible protein A [Pigmentibacter sp. JX0631]|uniref:competence/damage-inducible protein A n=1 Tax=Pigmentibacter sp. JX0631 TaxID=2976982 RepID=UPI002468CB48|nr:competence/damage-inducible protein A [Pigmentibacter sp. JX0631]WGL59254.1 competence/damage-inducible protein A [Pigmentibacter sp. JX0631]
MQSAGLLITGNEVLSAKTKDTNGPFMGMHLRKIGMAVTASMMCGDNETELLDCLDYLAKKSDVILMTGGLGPTSDDLTAQVVAKFFGISTEFNTEAWNSCTDFFIKAGRKEIPESNKKQAFLPKNCNLIPNELGTAVGFVVAGEKNGKRIKVFSMPGVPYEMEKMFLRHVLPELEDKSFFPVVKYWQVFFMGESFMQNAINTAEKNLQLRFPNSSVSYQAHPYYVSYSVTIFADSVEKKQNYEEFLNNEFNYEVEKAFQDNILFSEDKKVSVYLYEKLKQNKLSISFIENTNCGFLSKEFSQFSNDFDVFKGGLVYPSASFITSILNLPSNISILSVSEPEQYLAEVALRMLTLSHSKICLAEIGTLKELNNENKQELASFNFVLAFTKNNFFDFEQIAKTLSVYGWRFLDSYSVKDYFIFGCQIKNNARHSREIQQTRASLFLLCSLAKILSNP